MKNKRLLSMLLSLCVIGCGMPAACNGSSESGSVVESVQYTIQLPESIIGGTVSLDKSVVNKGDSVYITVAADVGYILKTLTANGVPQKVWENGKAVLSNIRSDVVLFVEFEKIPEESIVYVALEDAPNIDAKVDKVWDNVSAFYAENIYNDNVKTPFSEEFSYLKVMWNETGLYFLGYVYDSKVVSTDRFNIWFSEVYTNVTGAYSTDPSDGNYAICVNPRGENLLYTNMNVSQYWTVDTREIQDGYIVEIFMPKLGNVDLQEGNLVGLDLSVDYYSVEDYEVSNGTPKRDFYANWWGKGNYWSNVGALKPMKLVK